MIQFDAERMQIAYLVQRLQWAYDDLVSVRATVGLDLKDCASISAALIDIECGIAKLRIVQQSMETKKPIT